MTLSDPVKMNCGILRCPDILRYLAVTGPVPALPACTLIGDVQCCPQYLSNSITICESDRPSINPSRLDSCMIDIVTLKRQGES